MKHHESPWSNLQQGDRHRPRARAVMAALTEQEVEMLQSSGWPPDTWLSQESMEFGHGIEAIHGDMGKETWKPGHPDLISISDKMVTVHPKSMR